MELNFVNGKAIIKSGRKVIAKVYYLPDFFNGLNVNWDRKFPYSLEIHCMSAHCKDLAEVEELFYSEIE